MSRTSDAGVAAAEAADLVALRLSGPGGPDADRCDLVVVTVTPHHLDALDAVAAAIETRLEPGVLVGAVAVGVIGDGQQVEDGPGVSVFALATPGAWAQGFRAWTLSPQGGGVTVTGWPDTRPGDLTIVLADPASFPAGPLVDRLSRSRPGAPIVGGLVSAGDHRAGFILDGRTFHDGAVGVVLRDVASATEVSGACRAIGRPATVTQADGQRLLALAGRPATDHLDAVLRALPPDDLRLLESGGLQIGLVVDERRDRYGPGDFVLRGVLDLDADDGSVTIGDRVAVGSTVQFHLRDPVHAGVDLDAALLRLDRAMDGPCAGALLFTCAGRGRGLFQVPDHDVRSVERRLAVPVSGAVCDGELAPVDGRGLLHGFTATVLAFQAPEDRTQGGVTR